MARTYTEPNNEQNHQNLESFEGVCLFLKNGDCAVEEGENDLGDGENCKPLFAFLVFTDVLDPLAVGAGAAF